MSTMRYYLSRCNEKILIAILKECEKEFVSITLCLEERENKGLKRRAIDLKETIRIIKSMAVNRLLEKEIPLVDTAKQVCKTEGIENEVYTEVLKIKLIESNELISVDLLKKAIDKLSPEQLVEIIRIKEATVSGKLAEERYDEMLFDVSEDIRMELETKIEMDRREYKK